MEVARTPIVWLFVETMVRQVGVVQTVRSQTPLAEKKGVGSSSGLVVGAQSVVREPIVGQLVGQVVVGIVVEMGPSAEWWSVVAEPVVGQW